MTWQRTPNKPSHEGMSDDPPWAWREGDVDPRRLRFWLALRGRDARGDGRQQLQVDAPHIPRLSGFLQHPTEVHNMRNDGARPARPFLLPRGTADTAIRVDQSHPSNCTTSPSVTLKGDTRT